jgi:hypothetical protein
VVLSSNFYHFDSKYPHSSLQDIQLRVPMENEDDVQIVKDALLIKGMFAYLLTIFIHRLTQVIVLL